MAGTRFTGAMSNVGNVFQNSSLDHATLNFGAKQSMSEKWAECIGALGSTNPIDDRNVLIEYNPAIGEGTRQWILENDVFQKWKAEDSSDQQLVWICDRQGLSKTALAIFISQHLEENEVTDDKYWVLYYFCDGQDEDRKTAASVLRGFIYLLYNKQKDFIHDKHPDLVSKIYDEFKLLRQVLRQRHSVEPLWRIFQAMVNLSPVKRIFCVIDGVDVCDVCDIGNLEYFLMKIKGYFDRHNQRQAMESMAPAQVLSSKTSAMRDSRPATLPQLHMMILSRENPSCIGTLLGSFPRLELESDGSHIGETELDRHINAKIEEVSASCSEGKTPNQETTEAISHALRDGEERSFQWVDLAAEMLMGMKNSQLKRSATQMPKTVEEIYVQTLLRLSSRQRSQASTMLKWVTSAVRPLSTLELTKAIKYDLKTSFSKKALKKVVLACNGLVRRQTVQVHGEKVKQVVLASQSVHDFLFAEQSPLRENKAMESFVFERGEVHSELANTCVSYLQGSANLEKSRRVRLRPLDKLRTEDRTFLRKHPFLEYAIVNWTFHAKEGSLEKTNYAVPFFKDDSARRRLWWESYWVSLRQSLAWKWTAPGRFSLLHLAAFFDIVPLAQYVEQKGHIQQLLAAEDHQGMKPINWASERSQAAMAKFLLQHGDFDDEALRQAARTGEDSIVTMLLENRRKILQSPKVSSPRSSPGALSNPFDSIRKVTLSSISDWSKKLDKTNDDKSSPVSPATPGYGKAASETPLHIAATCGHDEATKVLLKYGENYNKTTDGGWTALHNAAWFGRVSIVHRLIAAGADAKAVTNEQLTPLHCAVKNSQPYVVECLLNKNIVDIEAEDQFGLTPFHMACKADNIPVMEVLLDYGASIEKKMKQGWTPLVWACMNGRFAVVQVLLRRGADVCVKWVHHLTEAGKSMELGPVGLAKAYRHEGIARLVESFGAADTNRVASDETKDLPPLETSEEHYDVPEVEDILVAEQDHGSTSGAPDASDSESSGESGESDDDSDIDCSETSSRKPSTNGILATGARRESSQALGLGIHEGTGDRSGIGEPCVDHELSSGDTKTDGIQQGLVEENVGAKDSNHSSIGLGIQANQPANSQSHEYDHPKDTHDSLITTEAGEAAPVLPSNDAQTDQRPSNPKLPGSFSDRFGKFIPRRGIHRTSSAASEEVVSPTEVTENPLEVVAEDGDAVAGAENPALDSPKAENKVFGRFGAKRGFSWKNDNGADTSKAPSPKTWARK